VHCDVPPAFTVVGLHVTTTEVIVVGADCTVMAAVPEIVVVCVLVAVTVTPPAEAGAVKSPLALMEPPLADHVTAEL
jgi:hypothetical protein